MQIDKPHVARREHVGGVFGDADSATIAAATRPLAAGQAASSGIGCFDHLPDPLPGLVLIGCARWWRSGISVGGERRHGWDIGIAWVAWLGERGALAG